MTTTYPIYLVGGSKGGVGKSLVALALADHLQRSDIPVTLVETDTSNPDVMKSVQDEMHCIAYDLDDADGWIGLVNTCDERRDAAIVVNTAARSQPGVARFGATLAGTLGDLQRELVVLWVINRQRDSLELLHAFSRTFPGAVTHVVRNGYFGPPEKFTLYRDSQLRRVVEAHGRSLDFPDLADRVADELRSQRLSIRRAAQAMHMGERAELLRWRSLCDTMFSKVIRTDGRV
ncbi:nucleotide-binding protein [Paraburkholderia kururiensis]|uniref:nucleotide-binding protein n=1 Tax=Paraburkholderia kururiensis TaxID=984307 RepID=UPI0018F56143|nr:P-loop NTPase [Paraburkholderia kururiensis]